MRTTIRLRAVQALLAAAYAVLAAIALARAASIATLLVSAAVMLGAYGTARTVPDVRVSSGTAWGIAAVPLVLLGIGVVAAALGGAAARTWVVIVMAYCAGNRLRAAGIGPAR
jgi:hypothetical protein